MFWEEVGLTEEKVSETRLINSHPRFLLSHICLPMAATC